MNEMIQNLGNRMAAKARMTNISRKAWGESEERFTETRPMNRYDYELRGMETALTAMGIPYDYDWDIDVPGMAITAIVIMGTRFEV